jgi:hypothetical protein
MPRCSGRFGLRLVLALVVSAPAARAADVARFDDLLRAVRSDPDPTSVQEKCGETVFTFSAEQRLQLRRAGATPALIDSLQEKRTKLDDVQNFALIVDCSGSMKERLPDGRTKMDAARAVLTELVRKIPDGLNVSLTLYGHDAAAKCEAVEVKRPLGEIDATAREDLTRAIDALKAVGATPIAAALRAAGQTLKGAEGLSQVVLVTDGMETCGGDPGQVAEDLAVKSHVRRVEVVGLGMKPDEKGAVTRIARRGRGKYYNAQTADELAPALRKVVRVAVEDEPPNEATGKLPAVVQILVDGLKDPNGNVRLDSAKKLGELGAKAKGATPELARRVADDRLDVVGEKDAALDALRQLSPERIEKSLTDAVKSKNLYVRRWALGKLGEWEKHAPDEGGTDRTLKDDGLRPVVKLLVVSLTDSNGNVRKEAAQALGELGAKARGAVPALMRRVADDKMDLSDEKDATLQALTKLAPERVEEALTDAAKSKNSYIKRWAIGKLTELEKANP